MKAVVGARTALLAFAVLAVRAYALEAGGPLAERYLPEARRLAGIEDVQEPAAPPAPSASEIPLRRWPFQEAEKAWKRVVLRRLSLEQVRRGTQGIWKLEAHARSGFEPGLPDGKLEKLLIVSGDSLEIRLPGADPENAYVPPSGRFPAVFSFPGWLACDSSGRRGAFVDVRGESRYLVAERTDLYGCRLEEGEKKGEERLLCVVDGGMHESLLDDAWDHPSLARQTWDYDWVAYERYARVASAPERDRREGPGGPGANAGPRVGL